MNRSLTAVPGVEVGHATHPSGATGCTVVLGPFRAVSEVRGLATGSRELGVLEPEHLVPRTDAVLFTGGSAFGLAAADGVMSWLRARGRGYDTGSARVPIVPAAVLYDLADGVEPPGPELGGRACDAASHAPVAEGAVGAGAGATVGKLAGRESASRGGVGSWARAVGPWTVGALAVVNALGEVRDERGHIVAGVRGPEDDFLPASTLVDRAFEEGSEETMPAAGTNTTLCLVATDAPLSALDLRRLARMAANALPRRIHPVNTPFDGDVLVAASSADETEPVSRERLMGLAAAAQETLEQALTRGVLEGT